MSVGDSRLTILLPTQNRPSFVRRALKFYEEESLLYKIHLIDSSEENKKAEVKEIVKSSGLNIEFHDYEFGASSFEKFERTLSLVDSEFVLMVADDDFIFPSAMNHCVEFLSANNDYTAASGRSYLFAVDDMDTSATISSIEVYPQLEFVSNSPELRFKAHMKNWTTSAYSVQRTTNLKEIIDFHKQFVDDIRFMEIHWYATNIIRGKVAKLNEAYMFRQISLQKEWRCDVFSDWTKTPGFLENKKILISVLAKEIAKKNNQSLEYNRQLCASALTGWLKDRRPFLIKNSFDYSMNYFWNKFFEKMGRNKLILDDKLVIERVKNFVRSVGAVD